MYTVLMLSYIIVCVGWLCTHYPRRWVCLIEDCCDHPKNNGRGREKER